MPNGLSPTKYYSNSKKWGAANVLKPNQKEQINKRYAAYAVRLFKERNGSKTATGPVSAILITFSGFWNSNELNSTAVASKNQMGFEDADKMVIAKKAATILRKKGYKVNVENHGYLSVWKQKPKKK